MKFAQVGYGSEGKGTGKQGEGYTYLVNDNVRVGNKLTPIVKHAVSEKIFVTTGLVISKVTNNMPNVVGKDGEALKKEDFTNAYRQSELGVKRTQGENGKFVKDRSTHDANGEYVPSKAELQARGKSIAVYNKEMQDKGITPTFSQGKATTKAIDSIETFDSYSAKFGGKK